jgi:hypothetical protein
MDGVQMNEKNNFMDIIASLMGGGKIQIIKMPEKKPVLQPEEKELAESLVYIARKYGKFNQDGKGIWAGYKPAAENTKASIGVKCANCVLYQGGGTCRIIDMPVEPEGKCRFAVIPDGVVQGYK